MRFRRAWSAPAAPLCRLRHSHAESPDAVASGDATSERTLPQQIYRFFPTRTCFAVPDVALPDAAEVQVSEAEPAAVSPVVSTPSPEALRSELQAAKHQIALLTAASSQSFGSYAALEAENARLKEAHAALQEENETLKLRLMRRDEEIGEQLHLICDLEKRLEEFSSLAPTNKATWNGRSDI